jgi:cyclohexanecarboxylate-CoA ligase
VVDESVAEADTFWALLARRAELTPDRLALVDERDRRLSFVELAEWSERVAAGLAERGVTAGTAFSWQLPTSLEAVVTSMALARLGAVQNPVISLYRQREVGSLLRTTRASWLAVPRVWRGFDYEQMAHELLGRSEHPFEILVTDDGLPEGDPAKLPPPPTEGDAVRWVYSTSGTTSEPKAVRHTDRTLIAGGIAIAHASGCQPDEFACIPFPFAHIGGPDQLVMMLRCGFGALLLETFAPHEAAALMRRYRVTTIGGSTAHYIALLAEQRKQPGVPVVPSLRNMTGGGAPKPPELYWQVKREMGVEIHHGFGMTESPMIAIGRAGDDDEQLANSDGPAVHGCEIRVMGPDDRPVPGGVDGEVEVRGTMLAKGYVDAAQTAESFRPDGWFRTGDRGYLRPDDRIVITGRTKELIIRKGENISPREIEDVLAGHLKVAAVAVIGLTDPERGERVCAVVERSASGADLTFSEMQAWCREAGLMNQKIPEQLQIIDALPRNPTMKVLKRQLIEQFRDRSPGG